MATRKKSPQARPGLLHGPSRKQFDVFTPRTGEYIKPEKHTPISIYKSIGSGNFTLLTVPTGFQAKILYYFLSSSGTGYANLSFSDPTAPLSSSGFVFIAQTLQEPIFNTFDYDGAPIVRQGQTIRLAVFPADFCFVCVVYTLESSSEGYFSN